MANAGTAYVDIDAKLDHFKRDMDKSMRSTASGIEKNIGGAFKKVALLGAGLIATAGVGQFFKDSVKGARESNKVAALTNSVIKSTGGIARVTAGHVSGLATKLSNLTGVDDELIQSGENLLLTFTGIRNEVGLGNDVFDRATTIANDMSVALGQDMKASAIQVGKALNDPIKGISALSKVGVSFTADQKKLVKELVNSGDALGAQKIILEELGREFGGAAAAAATPADKLKVSWGNLQEEVGNLLIPTLDRLASWLSEKIPLAIDKVKLVWGGFVGAFNGNGITSDGLVGVAEHLGVIAGLVFVKVIEFIQYVVRNKDTIIVVAAALGTFATALYTIVQASQALTAARAGLVLIKSMVTDGGALSALSNPYVLLAAAIIAIGVGAYFAYKKFKPFRDLVDGVFDKIQEVLAPVIHWFQELWAVFEEGGFSAALEKIGTDLQNFGETIWEFLTGTLLPKLIEWGTTAAKAALKWIADSAAKLPEILGGWLRSFASWVTESLLPALGRWGLSVLAKIGNWLLEVAAKIPGWLLRAYLAMQTWVVGTLLPGLITWGSKVIAAILSWIVNAAFSLPGQLARLILAISKWIFGTAIPKLIEWGVKLGAKLIGWIADEIPKLPEKLKKLITSISDWVKEKGIPKLLEFGKNFGSALWDGIVGFFKKAPGAALSLGKSIINALIRLLNAAIPDEIDFGLFKQSIPNNPIPEIHHDGGIIGRGRAPYGSNVPVIGQAGEGVLTLATMNAISNDLFGAATPSGTADRGTTNIFNIHQPTDADEIIAAQRRQERLYA